VEVHRRRDAGELARAADDPGYVGAVAVIVHRVRVIVPDVVARLDAAARTEATSQPRMPVVDAGVDDADDDPLAGEAGERAQGVGADQRHAFVERGANRVVGEDARDVGQ
jgi:hypothetical protein